MKTFLIAILFLLAGNSLLAQVYSQPESVVYDEKRDVYYVSNAGILGVHDGSILARLSDGSLKYIVRDNLIDPKGMYMLGDSLFVADVNKLHCINLLSNQIVATSQLNTANIFLNAIVADENGYLYISETSYAKIYRVKANNISDYQILDFIGTLASPNGMYFDKDNNRILIATYHLNARIMALDLETFQISLIKNTEIDYMDGITRDLEGNYLISSWGSSPNNGAIHLFDADFEDTPITLMNQLNGPADILLDTLNNILAIPLMGDNIVHFLPFTTSLAKPSLIYPPNIIIDMGTNIIFKWGKVPLAINYIFQLSDEPEFGNIIHEKLLQDTLVEINDLQLMQKYYWRVKAKFHITDSEWSDSWAFTTSSKFYEPPSLILPVNNEQFAPQKVSFKWNKTAAGLYHFQLWSNPDMTGNPVAEIKNLSDTAVNFTNPLPLNSTFYWRVQTFSGYISSDWSELWSFRVAEQVPMAPVLLSPIDKSTNIPINTDFRWNSSDGEHYALQVSIYNNFHDNVIDIIDLNDTIYKPELPLDYSTVYYWRVRSYSQHLGTWSFYGTFTTESETHVGESKEQIELKIYPLPSDDFVTIDAPYAVSSYQIFDLSGQLIDNRTDISTNTVRIDTKSLQIGNYIIIIKLGNLEISRKMIISR